MPDGTHAMVEGFDRAAEAYERSRPEYPAEAVRHLASELGIGPGRSVLDLGAGTGKFTRALGPTGARLLALEPTAGMRAILRRQLPAVPLVEGTAEAIDLPDGAVDAVVSAQAFHWFDAARASVEVARVLRPEGGLGLVWNLRDESVPWVAELTRILDRRDTGLPRGRSMAWRGPLEASGKFGPVHAAEFRFDQHFDLEGMLDRVRSISFIAMLPESDREQVLGEVRELLDRSPEAHVGGHLVLPYRTHVFWARRRPA
ncbi:MAG TPA: class I SAM-dependent methyltransferase [Thermoplasmata archaeon]|nr:class I SAM-dependent methyltransferase [Thermoplasmata archaeon]